MNKSRRSSKTRFYSIVAIIMALLLALPAGGVFALTDDEEGMNPVPVVQEEIADGEGDGDGAGSTESEIQNVSSGQADVPQIQRNDETNAVTLRNVENGKEDSDVIITMTDKREFEISIVLDENEDSELIEALLSDDGDGFTLELVRDEGLQDSDDYPYQFKGGVINGDDPDWTVWDSIEPLFNVEVKKAEGDEASDIEADHVKVNITISNEWLFGVGRVDNPRSNRNVILDYTGNYDLELYIGDESEAYGIVKDIRYAPYDSYRTAAEVSKELSAIEQAGTAAGLHVEVDSLGQTSKGKDIEYMIIAKDNSAPDAYLAFMESAMKNPEQYFTDGAINKSKLPNGIKVPILYSNIHPDETPGVDAILNFAWDLVDNAGGTIDYDYLTGFTSEGEQQLAAELEAKDIVQSSLLQDADGTSWTKYIGFINGVTTRDDRDVVSKASGPLDLDDYYIIDKDNYYLDVDELLNEVFFILVPDENVDGRTLNTRQNGNGFDLNRDNLFQTQPETQAMTQFIAKWNPLTFIELHGFVSNFQVEPCSPPHEPNFEYDLIAKNGLLAGEAFGIAAVANNNSFNSFGVPMRDYLVDVKGDSYWSSPWDDMSTNYTPQYSMLHGTVAYTIEVPQANEDATTALEYGLIGHADYVAKNKEDFMANQITFFYRGANNIDEESISEWYVSAYDEAGKEAEIFRPKYDGNDNFFPECYIIPVDFDSQRNISAAYEMKDFLIRNGVEVHKLNNDLQFGDTVYKAGSFVISMYQAKRNVANGAMYDGVVIDSWPTLYSEPITAFGHTRGFDYAAIDIKDAVKTASDLESVPSGDSGSTIISDKDIESDHIVILNNSVDTIKAVNKILQTDADQDTGAASNTVGIISEGDYKGHYLVDSDTFDLVKNSYVLQAVTVEEEPDSNRILKSPVLHIPGEYAEFSTSKSGDYGAKNFQNIGNTNRNFDVFAYKTQMGFDIAEYGEMKDADIIAGNQSLNNDEIAAVKAGMPYLGAGSATIKSVETILSGTAYSGGTAGSSYDALFYVQYVADSLVTDAYVYYDDTIMYSYGGGYISAVPESADVLIKATNNDFLEGFFDKDAQRLFKGSIQAFEYRTGFGNGGSASADTMDIAIFANTLTSKAHQQDDYRYAANVLFGMMTEERSDTTGQGAGSGGGGGSGSRSGRNTGNTADPGSTDPGAGGDSGARIDNFTDLNKSAWYYEAVNFVVSEGLFYGISDTEFGPDVNMTRAMFVTVLGRLAEASGAVIGNQSSDFTDVASGSWYANYVSWGGANNIVSGYSADTFGTNDNITREQLAVLFIRYADYAGIELDGSASVSFSDSSSVNSWAADSVEKAAAAGLISGYEDGTFRPQNTATRAEVASILKAFSEKYLGDTSGVDGSDGDSEDDGSGSDEQ